MDTVTIEEAQFVDRMINFKHRVKMPSFLAAHGIWDNWEPQRFDSMEANLHQGDILFDVGAEVGPMSAIYSRFVGAENMVLMESNPDNWQNIRATWELEGLATPKATFCGLVSDKSDMPEGIDYALGQRDGWPVCALTGRIWTPRSYRLIHEHAHSTAQTSIDAFVATTGIAPTAITIDVEGAEFKVLTGARKTLKTFKPLVWVSVHEDLMLRDYGAKPHSIYDVMEFCGYKGEHLATDHEAHHIFRPVA